MISSITCESFYDEFRTRTFADLYPTVTDFLMAGLNGEPSTTANNQLWYVFQMDSMPNSDKVNLYYLLYANFGNSHLITNDENRWRFKFFSLLQQFAPTWIKRKEVQKKLLALNEQELVLGGEATYNHAFNPETSPSTSSRDAINFINDQNKTLYTKTKMEGYANLLALLDDTFTTEFINHFKSLFVKVAATGTPLLYPTYPEDN